MAQIFSFMRNQAAQPAQNRPNATSLSNFLHGYSIEVMPRTAQKIEDFRALLPQDTRIYVAHIDGVPIEDMQATCRRLIGEGFEVMPHITARSITDARDLEARIDGYAQLGVRQALVLAGGIDTPRGPFSESMQLLETGIFDRYGFTRLHVAGHPEGNRDIDPDGGETEVMRALKRKSDFQHHTDARMAITTQFCFDAAPVIDWAARLREAGVTLPVHIGIAGPAKLQTMIKFAMACGVGASLRVLQRRAADLSKLMLPFEPDEILTDLAQHKVADPDFAVEAVHLFPLGGIVNTVRYTEQFTPHRQRVNG